MLTNGIVTNENLVGNSFGVFKEADVKILTAFIDLENGYQSFYYRGAPYQVPVRKNAIIKAYQGFCDGGFQSVFSLFQSTAPVESSATVPRGNLQLSISGNRDGRLISCHGGTIEGIINAIVSEGCYINIKQTKAIPLSISIIIEEIQL